MIILKEYIIQSQSSWPAPSGGTRSTGTCSTWRIPPFLADFIHARACKPICEKFLTRPTSFIVGRYGNFDKLAARVVIDAKERHPEVTLTLQLPYHPFDRPTPTPKGFDGTFYPPGMETVPKRVAIIQANRHMVEHSTHLIAYAWHPASNARALVEHAQIWGRKRKIHVENLVK